MNKHKTVGSKQFNNSDGLIKYFNKMDNIYQNDRKLKVGN